MRKIILMAIILLLTGCSAEYNVTIGENDIQEKVTIQEENSANFKEYAYGTMNYPDALAYFLSHPIATSYPQLDLNYNNVEVTYPIYNFNETKNQGLIIDYNRPIEEYNLATLAKACYSDFAVQVDENKVYFSTDKINNCFDLFPLLDTITLRVSSYYQVIGSNANQIDTKQNIYVWNISRNEKGNKPIYLTVDKGNIFQSKMTLLRLIKEYPILVIGTLALFITTIVLAIKERKERKNNEI